MTTINHIPERKTENAIKATLISWANVNSVSLITRNLNAEVTEPFCLITTKNAEPEIDGNFGNWVLDVELVVRSNAENDLDGTIHDNLAGGITDILLTSNVSANGCTGYIDALNASNVSGFTCEWFEIGKRKQETIDNSHITIQEVKINMLPQ